MNMLKSLGICGVMAALAGCGGEARTSPSDAQIQASLKQWQSHNIDSYQLNFRISCYCMSETTAEKVLHIDDGAITEAYYLDSGEPVPAGDLYQDLLTVEQAFELIHSLKAQSPFELRVSFDDTYGYPTGIHVEFVEDLADDEQSWYLSNLM